MKYDKIFILAGFLIWTSCRDKVPTTVTASLQETVKDTVKLSQQQIQGLRLKTGTAKLENAKGTLLLQGRIELPAKSMVSLSFPLGGYIRQSNMIPGMRVRKGEILAVIEDMQLIQLQQDYLTACEKLQLATTEYQRQKELNENKASSDKIVQQTRTEMETQKIVMHGLKQKLDLIGINAEALSPARISRKVNILSPINGFVTKVNAHIGKYVAPTDILFELIDPSDIHLRLGVFEKDLGALSVGQEVEAYDNTNPSKKHRAHIALIGRSLDENRMAELRCRFQDVDTLLVPGIFMNAEVTVRNRQALTLPEQAVLRWQGKYYVFIVRQTGTFQMLEVKPGFIGNKRQEIAGEGITPQTLFITENAYALLMKLKNSGE